MDTSFLHRHPKIEETCAAQLQGHVVVDANEWESARSILQSYDPVNVSLKITDELVNAQLSAESMANRNDFAEKYHNGRADGFVEARDIVESILLRSKS